MNRQHVLVLDDEEGFRTEITEYLTREGFEVHGAGRPSAALELVEKNPVDIALFDIRLPEMSGLQLLQKIKAQHQDIDVIMMTGYGDMNSVVTALRYGASDFLNKPFKLNEVKETIDRLTKYRVFREHIRREQSRFDQLLEDEIRLVGESDPMQRIKGLIRKIADVDDTTVLITGDSGTGKELVARAIHFLSDRKDHPFIPVNCSSIPEELFENEFFGHVKGSYTDAKYDQKGLFEVADKGTLFLDEIGDLKFSMQAKLLRVIEEKRISRIGHYNDRSVNVRVIAATNQDIEKMVKEKQFRSDLFHRLNLFWIDIPTLCERKDDIPLLFDYFVGLFAKKLNRPIKRIEKNILPQLMEYDFPGNVRELKHMIERAVILSDGAILREKDFPLLYGTRKIKKNGNGQSDQLYDLNIIEKESIERALEKASCNKSEAARLLNISRQALDRKIKKLNINLS
jgi:DNA-binding NtrC family response regulator